MRSFLTVLGIVIGVAAVITMVTLGNGATRMVADQISSLGSNLLILRPASASGRGATVPARPIQARRRRGHRATDQRPQGRRAGGRQR
jgi:putative ABC transport system permease protein